ncbi:peptidase inhibitor family I36 protein [Streptomyces clavuligerus]|nr:peptidase inhibitor family I36 protein [Streptomyces clavuligerus]WDN57496.1 peptidase inhibitor family I36 protein [Streptomyces clavuligerus]
MSYPAHSTEGSPRRRTGRRRAVRVRSAVLGAALAATLSMGVVTAPQAAAGNPYLCPQSNFCLWEHADYDGVMLAAVVSIPQVSSYMNDRGSSYWNRTGSWVTLYRDIHFQGGCLMGSIGPQDSATVVPAHVNDQTSSIGFSRERVC